MSRRVYLLGVGLALVALALAFTDWALSLRPGVTEMNAKRIRPGMTLAEVEAIVGKPNLGGLVLPSPAPPFEGEEWVPEVESGTLIWESSDGSIFVEFNRKGVATGETTWIPSNDARPGLLARLRAWLRW